MQIRNNKTIPKVCTQFQSACRWLQDLCPFQLLLGSLGIMRAHGGQESKSHFPSCKLLSRMFPEKHCSIPSACGCLRSHVWRSPGRFFQGRLMGQPAGEPPPFSHRKSDSLGPPLPCLFSAAGEQCHGERSVSSALGTPACPLSASTWQKYESRVSAILVVGILCLPVYLFQSLDHFWHSTPGIRSMFLLWCMFLLLMPALPWIIFRVSLGIRATLWPTSCLLAAHSWPSGPRHGWQPGTPTCYTGNLKQSERKMCN